MRENDEMARLDEVLKEIAEKDTPAFELELDLALERGLDLLDAAEYAAYRLRIRNSSAAALTPICWNRWTGTVY